MEKIYKSKRTANFIINGFYYPLYQYRVLNNGDFIDIKHIELQQNIYTKQSYRGFVKEDGTTFENVNDCVNYIRDVISEPISTTPIQEQINLEKDLYKKRVRDGQDMSAALMAELRVMSIANNLPREVNKFIEEKLERVKINVDRGWWITALEELEAQQPISFFTQDLYNRIHDTISNYIAENYV